MVFIAVLLFAWASSQGFVGIAAYIACWVFMFPIMVAVCLIGALLFPFIINENEEPEPYQPGPNEPRDDWEREMWEIEDSEYREAKRKLLAVHDPEATKNNND